MANQPVQTFENHVRQDPLIGIVFVLDIAALVTAITALALGSVGTAAAATAVAALGGALCGFMARSYSLKVQDRIVRLETRLRLAEVLPADLKGRIGEFTLGQLIALRFASDAELPELARKVLTDKIVDKTAIKKMIKNWQADFHRV